MNIIFEKMGNKHQKQVMDIFNYYISNGYSITSLLHFKRCFTY